MTHLRKMMLEELERRNYSDRTARGYISAVADFAQHFGKPPDQLGPDELGRYQAYLLKKRKLAVNTVVARVAASILDRIRQARLGRAVASTAQSGPLHAPSCYLKSPFA